MGPGHWQVVALSFFFYLVLPRPFPTQTRSEGCEYLPLRTPELFHGEMSQEPTLAVTPGTAFLDQVADQGP